MAEMNSFLTLIGMKKLKNKLMKKGSSHTSDAKKGNENLHVKLEKVVTLPKKEDLNSTSTDVSVTSEIQGGSTCKVEVVREEKSNHAEAVEAAYEGSDEHDESLSMKRDFSDFDLQGWVPDNGDETDPLTIPKNRSYGSITEMNERIERDEEGFELIQSGYLSDPGKRTAFWGSPKLKHSCSCLETRDVIRKIANQLPPSKPHSFENLLDLVDSARGEIVQGIQTSPLSVITSCSADKVMLKRQSSSQVLPSRSKKLWWKFFLWSHRNLHRPEIQKHQQLPNQDPCNQKEGYTSDTLEPSGALAVKKYNTKEPKKLESTGSLSIDPWNISGNNKSQNWNGSHRDESGSWPQNHWVAFSTESSTLSRVDEWVKSLDTRSVVPHDDHTDGEETRENSVFTPSPGVGRSPGRTPHSPVRSNLNLTEDVLQADNVIQSLNSFSTVAYIASMGLKVIPSISPFATLRSVNLSGNFIVHITPGSMPKGLHTLNLSRNKITAIEGLRELTKLRVLDLSYNRIARIGQGLSNCTIIKELYLAGNKISDVEGLHRLLKLTVLDLSFNRVTTAKSLGQLVANYNSLLALNLLGNPIQSNIGDDQLRKTVSNLLPQLAYLNKQPIKPQRTREAVSDSVARAALGNNGRCSRRKVPRRVNQGASSRSRINEGAAHRSRHRLKNNRQR